MNTKKALKKKANFSARGSACPICKKDFRTCPHSVLEAEMRLNIDLIKSIK